MKLLTLNLFLFCTVFLLGSKFSQADKLMKLKKTSSKSSTKMIPLARNDGKKKTLKGQKLTTSKKIEKNMKPKDISNKKIHSKQKSTIKTTKRQALNKIINGIPAKRDSNPWIVSIGLLSITNYTHLCGGSIVSKQHIVTSANCVINFTNNFDYRQYYLTNGRILVAVIGVEDLTNINIINLFNYKNIRLIVKVTYNTNFNNTGDPFDVAVLKLDDYLKFTYSVQPINLPYTYDPSLVFGRTASIAGWGVTEAGILSKYLLYAYVTIVNNIEITLCGSQAANFYCVLDKTPRKANICFGDSGGPLVVYYNYKPYLFGIASFAQLRNNTCVNTLPSFYTMIPKVLYWIKQQLY